MGDTAMVRTPWTKLARNCFEALAGRMSARGRRRQLRHRLRRVDGGFGPIWVAAEVLESRQLLSAPMAMSDSYAILHDHTLTVTTGNSVLNNDMNMGMGTMTAALYASPSHGSLRCQQSDHERHAAGSRRRRQLDKPRHVLRLR
jgi:hypothetical protein